MYNKKEKSFTVYEIEEQDTSLGKNSVETEYKTIKAKLFTRAGNSSYSNNVFTVNSTHLALTKDKSIKSKMILVDADKNRFTVDYVIPDGYEAQLFLKAVE